MILSFGWTTPALVADPCQKTETSREWTRTYADQVRRQVAAGRDVFDAWNTSPRNTRADPKPGKIGRVHLLAPPQIEHAYERPPETWEAEGFEYLTRGGWLLDRLTPMELWRGWLEADPPLYVVRFELVDLTAYGRQLRLHYAFEFGNGAP